MGSDPILPHEGRRRSLRQVAAAEHRLLDEEDVEDKGAKMGEREEIGDAGEESEVWGDEGE
ncbi:UNVERIFIED_CONTAM: hypothetical protein Sangu_2763900 [Sesamum angustifolium]|uniref:Uncharacterized protein n=1 Tax=Sesamum angustifolium TaxID=2727405 RepID=A0AAW2IUE2_9LAMI